ncbi:hypothetical protein Pan97_13060 [Bremerella volcania]|uniref:Uncharacterized protein n=1 Tax=Bremerella volcania TaxID=2527984 RepID=A0A518C4Z2_9BACT|nr:hypothetical protein [Bremerella volcania]QDU74299.1 hypothetical protein Pan97_13060 [Bremerella volcania]
MQFRRNGLRDERRRRALMDDRASDSGNQPTSNTADDVVCRSARTYSKTAVDERRIRIVDVVPVYLVQVTLIYAAIVLTVAVLLAMHHYGANIVRWADLSRVDSLGTYLSAGSLFVGAMLAFLTYRIRRHRLDDYRGRYRCWLWFAGLLLFASLDCMLNFRSDVARGLEAVTRVRLLGQTDGWWVVVWCVAYGSMTLRALIEVRESVGTVVVGLISAGLLFTGMALQMDLLLLPSGVPTGLALHAAQLLGVGLLLTTLVQYSRFVWLDAQGLISRRSVRVEEEGDEEAKPRKTTRRSRTAAKKPAAKEPTQEDEEAKPRRGWFSLGRKKSEESEEEAIKPVRKPAAKSTGDEASADEKPKRGWFSFGKKNVEDESAEQESKAPAKPKVAPSTVDDQPAEEKPKRSWFSWGKKSSEDAGQEEGADAGEARTTMNPRVKTRPKQQPAAQERPAANQAPTITGRYSQNDEDSENSSEDEEILRLESKPDHLLSKAERRRLKKLKRRSAA